MSVTDEGEDENPVKILELLTSLMTCLNVLFENSIMWFLTISIIKLYNKEKTIVATFGTTMGKVISNHTLK